MSIDGINKKVFNLDDLNSLISFEDWLKKSLSIYPEDKKVPSSHIVDLLNYIKSQVESQRIEDKRVWLDKLDKLIERAKNV